MNKIKTSFSFLAIGKTAESKEATEFKRYIGVGASKILAVNPTKAELDKIMGYESQNEPEYTGSDDDGKWARVTFIVETDPDQCNGIDIKNRVMFTLRNTTAYNRDKTKVQVIDDYGNKTWANDDEAKAEKKLIYSNGNTLKIADKYRMACSGEADLVAFLKAYLCVDDAFNYANGSWNLKPNADDYKFALEDIKKYFDGDFSEVKDAIKLQPNNKVKLLYGVRTNDDGRQFQAIATRNNFVLRNSAGSNAIARLEKELFNAKQAGSYASTEFKVQELAEYNVEPTDLSQPANSDTATQGSEDAMPWD